VMFGASKTRDTVSYAITSTEVAGDLRQAVEANTPTATGSCL
jgi:hypothetical protein